MSTPYDFILPLSIPQNTETPSKIINKIISELAERSKVNSEWDNGYSDYNERHVDRPAWSEHSDRGYSDRGGPNHSDHAKTYK